jgi:hypothetical protein
MEPQAARIPLGEILIQQGLATQEDVQRALELQKLGDQRPLGSILLSQTEIGSEDLSRALAEQFHMEWLDVEKVTADPAAVALVPAEFAWRYLALPYAFEEGRLCVAVFDPIYTEPLTKIRELTSVEIKPALTTLEALQKALRRCYRRPPVSLATEKTPPLHERKEDLRRMIGLFLKDCSGRNERGHAVRISRLALDTLLSYPWDGARDLLDAVECACKASPLDVIRLQHLPEKVRRHVVALKKTREAVSAMTESAETKKLPEFADDSPPAAREA